MGNPISQMGKVRLREGMHHIKVTRPARAGRESEPQFIDSKAGALNPSALLCGEFPLFPQQTAALWGVSPAVLESLRSPKPRGRFRVMELPPRRLDASPGPLMSSAVTFADEQLPSWSQSIHCPTTGRASHVSPDSPEMNSDCLDKLACTHGLWVNRSHLVSPPEARSGATSLLRDGPAGGQEAAVSGRQGPGPGQEDTVAAPQAAVRLSPGICRGVLSVVAPSAPGCCLSPQAEHSVTFRRNSSRSNVPGWAGPHMSCSPPPDPGSSPLG